MRKLLPCTLAAGLVLALAASARAQDGARAVIEKAIKAHGGEAQLAKLRADRVEAKGTVYLNDMQVPFTATTLVQLPGQFKNTMRIALKNGPATVVQVLNGDKGWVSVNGQVREAEGKELAQMKDMMYLDRVVRLTTLLQDKGYELQAAGESKVNDRPAVGVLVKSQGHKDVQLFFDKDSGLLVKTEHQVTNERQKEVRQEELYSDFRDLGGFRRPMKVVAYQDGKKTMEGELTDVKYVDRLADTEFGKP